MHRASRAALTAALGSVSLFLAGHARADVTVIGNGFAAECSDSAKAVSVNHVAHADALNECTLAIENESLSTHELAATHVNRGVLYLAIQRYEDAKRDFDSAVRIEPGLGEAYANRGAALIGEGRNADAIAEIDRGLELNATEPEKSYYNKALAEENLNDLKSAYSDYSKALELKPDWEMAKLELARFHVVQQ